MLCWMPARWAATGTIGNGELAPRYHLDVPVARGVIAFSTFQHIVPVYFVAPYLALFALRSPVLRGPWAQKVRGLTGETAHA